MQLSISCDSCVQQMNNSLQIGMCTIIIATYIKQLQYRAKRWQGTTLANSAIINSNKFKCNRTLIYLALKIQTAKILHYTAYHTRKILAHWHLNNDDISVYLCSVQANHDVHQQYDDICYMPIRTQTL